MTNQCGRRADLEAKATELLKKHTIFNNRLAKRILVDFALAREREAIEECAKIAVGEANADYCPHCVNSGITANRIELRIRQLLPPQTGETK